MAEDEEDWIALGVDSDDDNANAGLEEYGEPEQAPTKESCLRPSESLAGDISDAAATVSPPDKSLLHPGTDIAKIADNSSSSSDSDSDGAPRRRRVRSKSHRADDEQETQEYEEEAKPGDRSPQSKDAARADISLGKEATGDGAPKSGGAATGRLAATPVTPSAATASRGIKRPHNPNQAGPDAGLVPANRRRFPPAGTKAASVQATGQLFARRPPGFVGGPPRGGPTRPPMPGIDLPMGLGTERHHRPGVPMHGERPPHVTEFSRGRVPIAGAAFRGGPVWVPRGREGVPGPPLARDNTGGIPVVMMHPNHLRPMMPGDPAMWRGPHPVKVPPGGHLMEPGWETMDRRVPFGDGPPFGMMVPLRPPAFELGPGAMLPRWGGGPAPRPMLPQPQPWPAFSGPAPQQRGVMGPRVGRK